MVTSISSTFSQTTSAQRRTLVAAALGWMLDAFDAMLYALVLAHVMRDLGMSKGTAGLLNSLTLLTYSVCSFASGLSTSVLMLAVFRFILGLGMGGEWNTGTTLVAETWPTELRAKAISVVQRSWAIGYALAALVTGVVLHYADWRMVFFVGVLPALITLWIQSSVPESAMWEEQHRLSDKRLSEKRSSHPGMVPGSANVEHPSRRGKEDASFAQIFRPPY